MPKVVSQSVPASDSNPGKWGRKSFWWTHVYLTSKSELFGTQRFQNRLPKEELVTTPNPLRGQAVSSNKETRHYLVRELQGHGNPLRDYTKNTSNKALTSSKVKNRKLWLGWNSVYTSHKSPHGIHYRAYLKRGLKIYDIGKAGIYTQHCHGP